MSQSGGKSSVGIADAKELRRTSITSLLGPWAKAEHLRLTPFSPDQAREALDAVTDLRMLIFSVGGDSIAEHKNLQQVKSLRALASKMPLVIISDSDDADDVAAAFSAQAQGFINTGISSSIAYQALSFIMKGGTYFPPSVMLKPKEQPEQVDKPYSGPSNDSEPESKPNGKRGNGNGSGPSGNGLGCQSENLTTRQWEVLRHLRMGESNKVIARRLGMTEGTVKVHIRQMMRKCRASNRTQLALGRSLVVESRPIVGNGSSSPKPFEKNGTAPFTSISVLHRGQSFLSAPFDSASTSNRSASGIQPQLKGTE